MVRKHIFLHIIGGWLLPAWLALTMLSCSEEDSSDASAVREVTIQLGISLRDSRSTTGEVRGEGQPTNLMVWIFKNDGTYEKVDFQEITVGNSNPFSEVDIQNRLIKTIKDWQLQIHDYSSLKFVVLLNTESVEWEPNLTLDANTAYDLIKGATYSGLASPAGNKPYQDNEILMFGEADLILDNRKEYFVSVEAKRTVGKLDVFITQEYSDMNLTVTSLTLSGIPNKGFIADPGNNFPDIEYNKSETIIENGTETLDGKYVLSGDYLGNFSEQEALFKSLYQTFLLENPNGEEWVNVSEDKDDIYGGKYGENAYTFTMKYTIGEDTEEKEKSFSLPRIERNSWHKVYIRVLKNQEINLNYTVCPWVIKNAVDIHFD